MRVLDLQGKNKLIITKDIFRAYDIRGVYPEQINEDVYNLVGKAIGTYINNQNAGTEVCLCADGRLSSPTLKKSLIEGLISTGIDVVEHPEYKIWIPEMKYYHLRTGTNYNKSEKKIVGG